MTGRDEIPFSIRNRSTAGGVNTRVFATDIREDQAQQLQNVDSSTPGQREIRAGSTVCATGITAGPILALREYNPDGSNSVLLAISPDTSDGHARLWEWDGTGAQFSLVGTLTGFTHGVNADYQITPAYDLDSVVLNSRYIAYISHSKSGVGRYYYDGTDLVQLNHGSSTPNAKVMAHTYFMDRLFVTGDGLNRTDITLSNVALVAAQGATVFGNVPTYFRMAGSGRQEIVRLIPFRSNNLVAFLSDKIAAISTTGVVGGAVAGGTYDPSNNWIMVDIHDTIGCAGFHAVANTGEDIYFADQTGNIRSLARTTDDAGQGVKSLPVSESIQSYINRINPTATNKIVLEAFDRWLLVGLPLDNATEPDHVFALDVARSSQMQFPAWDGPWTSTTGAMKPWCMEVAALENASVAADQNPTLYVGSTVTANGEVYRLFRGNDDSGNGIQYQEISKRYNNGSLELDKSFHRAMVFAVGSGLATLQVEANLDAKGFEHVGYVSLSGDTPLLPQALPLSFGGSGVVESTLDLENLADFRAKDISFRLTATATADLKILGFNVFGYMETWDREPD